MACGYVAKVKYKYQSCGVAPRFRVVLWPKSKWPKWPTFEIWVHSKNKFILKSRVSNSLDYTAVYTWARLWFLKLKCRSQNIANCPLEYVAQSLRKVYRSMLRTAILWFGRSDRFFDSCFQYQSCGIDPDICVVMWPKFFGQFGHVAWEFCANIIVPVPSQKDKVLLLIVLV